MKFFPSWCLIVTLQVKDFWPHYWGGGVVYDQGREFFKALGGGKLLKDKFISGFVLNPRAIANYKRAKAMGLEQNFKGEGEIKGGLFIIGRGRSGIAYQFIERNFGDWAPLAEVIEICTQMQVFFVGFFDPVLQLQYIKSSILIIFSFKMTQNQQEDQSESIKS